MRIVKFLSVFVLISLLSCTSDDSNPSTEEQQEETQTEPPLLIVPTASNIGINEVDVSAEVTSAETTITDKGFCWGFAANPNLDNFFISKGAGEGAFQATLEDLEPESTYYVRAYATDENGTVYSEQTQFETLDICDGNTYVGDVYLNSQQQIDDFGSNGYCAVDGYLRIEDTTPSDPIVDLSPLSTLKKVRNFIVVDCQELQTLEGLNNLMTLEELLGITNNNQLQSLSALSSVAGDVGRLVISGNDLLSNLDGLEGITSATYRYQDWKSLIISDNYQLINIDALSNVTKAPYGIELSSNFELTSINGLSSITEIESGSLYMYRNESLETLNGLQNLTYISEDLTVIKHDNLLNFDHVSSLTEVARELKIEDNPSLIQFDALQSITNESILVRILDNESLTSIKGLLGLTKAEIFIVDDCPLLPNLQGIQNLMEVERFFRLSYLEVSALTELQNLKRVGSIRLNSLDNIQNLDDLENIIYVGDYADFRSNEILSDYCGLNNLIFNGELIGDFTTSHNAYNPTLQDIIDGNCSL